MAIDLTGVRTNRGNEAYGYVPTVPDPTSTAATAVSGNLSNLGNIENLANQTNTFQQQQLINEITKLYPQFTSTTNQLGANIADWSQGKISQSTINQLAQNAAQRGAAGGMDVTSPNANAALMAVLGKTSEGLQNQALSAYSTLTNAIPKVTPTSLTDWMTTPTQQYTAQLLSNIYSSAADPATAANAALKTASTGLNRGYNATGAGSSSGRGAGVDTSTQDLLNKLIERTAAGGSSAGGGTTSSDMPMTDEEYMSYYENLPYTGVDTTSQDTSGTYYDISGLTDTGGVDFLDWAYSGE